METLGSYMHTVHGVVQSAHSSFHDCDVCDPAYALFMRDIAMREILQVVACQGCCRTRHKHGYFAGTYGPFLTWLLMRNLRESTICSLVSSLAVSVV